MVWVVNVYQIAMVATLLPLGALGEIVGHQRIYIGGLVLFTLASLGCALAWSLPSLLVARALQGLGASGIMAVNAALVRFVYPTHMLGRGFGHNALVVGDGVHPRPDYRLRDPVDRDRGRGCSPSTCRSALIAIVIGLKTLPKTPRADARVRFHRRALTAAASGCSSSASAARRIRRRPCGRRAELGRRHCCSAGC